MNLENRHVFGPNYRLLLLMAVFIAMMITGGSISISQGKGGWVLVAFVALMAALELMVLHYLVLGRPRICVSDDGLEAAGLFGRRKWPWAEVTGIRVFKARRTDYLHIHVKGDVPGGWLRLIRGPEFRVRDYTLPGWFRMPAAEVAEIVTMRLKAAKAAERGESAGAPMTGRQFG